MTSDKWNLVIGFMIGVLLWEIYKGARQWLRLVSLFFHFDGVHMGNVDGRVWEIYAAPPWHFRRWYRFIRNKERGTIRVTYGAFTEALFACPVARNVAEMARPK